MTPYMASKIFNRFCFNKRQAQNYRTVCQFVHQIYLFPVLCLCDFISNHDPRASLQSEMEKISLDVTRSSSQRQLALPSDLPQVISSEMQEQEIETFIQSAHQVAAPSPLMEGSCSGAHCELQQISFWYVKEFCKMISNNV